jgi:hypothetical protein
MLRESVFVPDRPKNLAQSALRLGPLGSAEKVSYRMQNRGDLCVWGFGKLFAQGPLAQSRWGSPPRPGFLASQLC